MAVTAAARIEYASQSCRWLTGFHPQTRRRTLMTSPSFGVQASARVAHASVGSPPYLPGGTSTPGTAGDHPLRAARVTPWCGGPISGQSASHRHGNMTAVPATNRKAANCQPARLFIHCRDVPHLCTSAAFRCRQRASREARASRALQGHPDLAQAVRSPARKADIPVAAATETRDERRDPTGKQEAAGDHLEPGYPSPARGRRDPQTGGGRMFLKANTLSCLR